MTIFRAVFTDILDHECYECRYVPARIHSTQWYTSRELAEQQAKQLRKLRDKLQDEQGIEYYNEYSDAQWVWRYKISKAQKNLLKVA